MMLRRISLSSRRNLRLNRFLQMGLVVAFWLLGQKIVQWTGLSLPGGLVGMALVLVLLLSRLISPQSLRNGANWFIAEMLLFFVPAVLAVLDHREFLGLLGLKILAITVVGTVIVMSVTAFSVILCERISTGLQVKNNAVE